MTGALNDVQNKSYYLYMSRDTWTMTPYALSSVYPNVYYVEGSTTTSAISEEPEAIWFYTVIDNYNMNVRPVISLKLGVEFEESGDGTPTNPYVVKYN